MTRKMLILIAVILLGSALAAQSITVTSPNNGSENWVIGGPNQTISWTHSGYPAGPPPVKLVLFKDGIDPAHKIGNIVENISIGSGGNGSYSWVVGRYDGGTAAAGTGYYIRVVDMNGTARDESDHPFTLTSSSSSASITVTAPDAGTSWRPGSSHTITWTKSGDMPAMAQITLRREGAPETEDPVLRIVDGTANNGSRMWFIPDSLAEGRYFVRVRASTAVRGDSAVFSINASGDRSEVAGPDTWIRCDLELAGVGVEYYNGNIVAWVKNNGPDTMRDHDVRFRLNYPEGGAGEQIYTHRITVANGAEKSVALLVYPGQIPDAGLRTIVSIDTAGSHIQDSNRYNQHRDVRLYPEGRNPVDLSIMLYGNDTRITYVLLDAGGPFFRRFRIRATMHLRNRSDSPAEITRVKCNWLVQSRNTFETEWRDAWPHSNGSLQLGPFRRGEETTCAFEFDFVIKDYHDVVYRRILFELDPDHLLNDPDRNNNRTFTAQFDAK